MALRSKLMPLLSWKIGDGGDCRVYGQPWFPGAMDFEGGTVENRRLVIRDLGDLEQGGWDVDQLVQRFGYQNSIHILSNIQPPSNNNGNDIMVFHPSANGTFSVKHMYHELNDSWRQPTVRNQRVWRKIWKFGSIQPRLRLFIWKLVRNALPLAKTIASRLHTLSPICVICSQEDEDGAHMAFKCPFARACWASSPLPLRTEQLPHAIPDIVSEVLEWATADQWSNFANIIWAIWRCRNSRVYQGEQPSLAQFLQFHAQIKQETSLVQTVKGYGGSGTGTGTGGVPQNTLCCFTDASWVNNWETGLGFVLQTGDSLVAYGVNHCTSASSLQAEAKALLEAIRFVVGNGYEECSFCTDCSTLAEVVSQTNPPVEADWRAAKEILTIWEMLRAHTNYKCVYISRCHNELADYLAGIGRRERLTYLGFTYPMFKM
ncbi:uncharacterized protein LOC144573643 [Carex rostrata]